MVSLDYAPYVQYAYEDGIASNEAKFLRPDYVTYPGPSARRVVYYNYPTSGVGESWHGHLARESQGRLGPAVAGEARGRDARDTCLRRGFGRQARGQDAHGTHGRDAHATLGGRTKYADYTYLGAGTVVKVAYPAVTGTPALTYGTSANNYPGFDRFGRVVDQKWQTQSGTPVVKDQFKYGYDRTSNRLYRTNELNHDLDELYHANGPSGAYDGLDRLTDFRRGTLTDTDSDGVLDTVADNSTSRRQEWTLDPVGNWSGFKSSGATTQPWDLDQARLHNKANEIADTVNQTPNAISGSPDWVDPAYDLAGNMTKGPQPRYETADANSQWYKYDAWNRLTRLGQGASSPGATVATYSYDGQNRRIRKAVAGGDTYDYYYNESWQVLEVCKASRTNKTYQQYIWGIQYIDAPVVQFRDTADDGTLDQALYYTYDGNFNVTALIGTNGTVAERYVYDPYGKVSFLDGSWGARSASAYDNEILYCGYRFDPESGLYHVRERYYDPITGTWKTRDPSGYVDGVSLYEYCTSNPEVRIDPWGMDDTIPLNDYWKGWKESHPGLTDKEYDLGYKLLGYGCVGIAQLELGHPIGLADLNKCYDTLERAQAKQKELKKTGECCDQDATGQTGQSLLFFVDFWAGSDKDVKESRGVLHNKKSDFPVDKKTGLVDMSKWKPYSQRKRGVPNFNFGSLLDPAKDEWYDANHLSKKRATDAKTQIPKEEMEIYKASLANRSSPNEYYNFRVFCVACKAWRNGKPPKT
jgi:RHS repeat-associated protein